MVKKRQIYIKSKPSAEELDAFWRGDEDTFQRLYKQRQKAESDAVDNAVSDLESKGATITYNPRNNDLKEVVITAKGPNMIEKAWDNTSTDDKIDAAITTASFIPGLDTAADVADAANQFRQGNWGWGLLELGAAFVPGLSMPYIRKGWDLYRKSKVAKAIDSDISRKIWEYNKHPQRLSPDIAEIPIQKDYMYHANSRPTYPKTSLAFFEKTPQSINPKGSWTYPYTNNMGEYDFKFNSVNTNNFGELLGEGSEQVVFTNLQEPEKVLKIYNDVGHQSLNDLRKFVKRYQTRNNVPFQLPTTFEGYVTNKGLKYPVFSQKRITNTIPLGLDNWNNNIIPRLNKQMKSVGFEGNGYYTRGSREIGDIQPGNLTELSNGQFRFIDAYPEGFKKGGKL